MREEVKKRFGPVNEKEDAFSEICALRQTGTGCEYVRQFTILR